MRRNLALYRKGSEIDIVYFIVFFVYPIKRQNIKYINTIIINCKIFTMHGIIYNYLDVLNMKKGASIK